MTYEVMSNIQIIQTEIAQLTAKGPPRCNAKLIPIWLRHPGTINTGLHCQAVQVQHPAPEAGQQRAHIG